MKRLLFSLLILSSVTAGELSTISELDVISRKHVYIPPKLGKLQVAETNEGFSIVKDDEEIPVKFHNTNHLLRHIKEAGALKQFLSEGAIFVSQDNGGDYILTARGKIKGGGPICGWLAGMAVRAAGYGIPTATATIGVIAAAPIILGGTTVAATGGTAVVTTSLATTGGAAAGTLTATIGAGATTGISVAATATSTTLAIGTGTTAVALELTAAGTAAAGTAVAGAATTAIVNPITTFGTATGLLSYGTFIEGLAASTQAAVTLMPWCP